MEWHRPVKGGSAADDKISYRVFFCKHKSFLFGKFSAEWISNLDKITKKNLVIELLMVNMADSPLIHYPRKLQAPYIILSYMIRYDHT